MKKNQFIAKIGILLALCISLSVLEGAIPLPLPLGIKLGLSNVIIMFTLLSINTKSAISLSIMKSLFVLLTRGVTAFAMSFFGGILAIFLMILVSRRQSSTLVLISVVGGISHNLGQALTACILLQLHSIMYYVPILVIGGVLSGIVSALFLNAIFPILRKLDISERKDF